MAAKYKTMLHTIRKATGKSGAQVAREMGISPGTYSTWETGRVQLKADRILMLCSYFGCTPNEILGVPEQSEYIRATSDEVTLVEHWRHLNPSERHLAMGLIEYMGNR